MKKFIGLLKFRAMSMLKGVIHNLANLSKRAAPRRSRSAGTKLLLSSQETAEALFLPKVRAFCNSTDIAKNEAEVIKVKTHSEKLERQELSLISKVTCIKRSNLSIEP